MSQFRNDKWRGDEIPLPLACFLTSYRFISIPFIAFLFHYVQTVYKKFGSKGETSYFTNDFGVFAGGESIQIKIQINYVSSQFRDFVDA